MTRSAKTYTTRRPAGSEIARQERARLERDGIATSELRACAAEGPDGTRLGGCVKTYLPRPAGPSGMVFSGDTDKSGKPVLIGLAFGLRHPRRAWQPSVYQVAHARLHGAPHRQHPTQPPG